MTYFGPGGNWWLRYVLVPLMVGGTVVPALILLADQASAGSGPAEPAKQVAVEQTSVSAPVAPGTPAIHLPTPSQQSMQQAVRNPAPVTAQQAAPQTAQLHAQQIVPQISLQKPKEPHRPYFYAENADQERFPTSQISAHKGDSISLHWVVDPSSVTGEIHLRSESETNQTISDSVVEKTGAIKLTVAGPAKMVLTEVRPEGERFLADLDIAIEN